MYDYSMDNIKFEYVIESVGLTVVGDYKDVVCEIRYFFQGHVWDQIKERYYVQHIDHSLLNVDTFIKIEDITKSILMEWLEKSIHPENISNMKQSIYELYNPPVHFVNVDFFDKKK